MSDFAVSDIPIRTLYLQARRDIYGMDDAASLKTAYENYIRAKVEFETSATEKTLIHLNGKYARFTRIRWAMEEKYGRERSGS